MNTDFFPFFSFAYKQKEQARQQEVLVHHEHYSTNQIMAMI